MARPTPVLPRGRLDDRAAGLELAGRLGGLDHPQGDAVLHRAAGVEVLDLGQHRARRCPRSTTLQLDQRGVADEVGDVLGVLHAPIVSDCRTRLSAGPRVTGPAHRARTPAVVTVVTSTGRGAATREEGLRRWAGHDARARIAASRGLRRRRSGSRASACSALVGYGLLKAEARWPAGSSASRSRGAPDDDGVYGAGPGEPDRAASSSATRSAAGMGVDSRTRPSARSSPPASPRSAAARSRLTNVAVVGAESSRPGRPGRNAPRRACPRRTSR